MRIGVCPAHFFSGADPLPMPDHANQPMTAQTTDTLCRLLSGSAPYHSTRCIPTQTELDSYLHATSYNKPDDEIENIFGYVMKRRSEDRLLLSSNC
jgi:hypothetical protein